MTQYFFVGGNPKSGTTWLQLLLDAHPAVTCSGEGHFMDKLLGPMIKVKEVYNQQQALDAERVYEGKPFYSPLENSDIVEVCRALIIKIMNQRATRNSRSIGDKTPLNNRNFSDLVVVFPQAKFINIVRHPYDVTVSRLHHALRAGYADALDPTSESHLTLVKSSTEAWLLGQQRVEQFSVRHPGRIRQVRYEDMLENPAEIASGLYAFIGVSATPEIVDAAVATTSFKTLSGRERGEENKMSFFRKGVAGDWKGVLTERAFNVINPQCRELMEKYGYEIA